MPRITLHAAPLTLEIDPDLGAGLTGLWLDGPNDARYPILRPAPPNADSPNQLASSVLAPWPNRIAGGVFSFGEDEYRLRPNFEGGHAIHGDASSRPWTIADRSPVSTRLTFDSRSHARVNFPFDFGCVLRAELHPDAVDIQLAVTNLDDRSMPAGCGHHPFFSRRLWSDDDVVELRAGVGGRYPASACVPTGPAEPDDACAALARGGPLGAPGLDDCFSGFDGRAEVRWPSSGVSLQMECSEAFDHLVVFTPSGQPEGALSWFCVEPQTMANDGFNLDSRGIDAGVAVLEPGQTLNTRVTVRVSLG